MECFLSDRLRLYRGLLPPAEAAAHLAGLLAETAWQSPFYDNPDGRRVHLPRLTANYGEESYDYSGLRFEPLPWTPRLLHLKALAESLADAGHTPLNALILQRYRDGADRLGWHADDSPRLGPETSIVSFSLGASRDFEVRARSNRDEGIGVAEALDELYYLEKAAQLQVLALSTGRPLSLVPDQVAARVCQQWLDDTEAPALHLKALQQILDRDDPDYRD